jgi:hypothetical protein
MTSIAGSSRTSPKRASEKSDDDHDWLLCTGGERPSNRNATDKGDELAPSHRSILHSRGPHAITFSPASCCASQQIRQPIGRFRSFASIPRCPSYVRLDSESDGKADIVRVAFVHQQRTSVLTVLSRRALKKTSRSRLGARTFGDTTPADVEVTLTDRSAHSRYRQEAQRRDERRLGGPTPNAVSHRNEPKT